MKNEQVPSPTLKLAVSTSRLLGFPRKIDFLLFSATQPSKEELNQYIQRLPKEEQHIFHRYEAGIMEKDVMAALAWLAQRDHGRGGVVFLGEKEWPTAWETEEFHTLFYFFQGQRPNLGSILMQVTGTRRATPAALRAAYAFGLEMGYAGIPLLTGLSAGVEQASAEGVLDAGGEVIALLPGGLSYEYPYCPRLRRKILEKGTLLSCNLPTYPARPWSFSRKSQLSGTLATITVAIQYPACSGVRYVIEAALDHGREVYVHAAGTEDGQESIGSKRLVEEGAEVISSYCNVAKSQGRGFPFPQLMVSSQRMRPLDRCPCSSETPVHYKFGTWYSVRRTDEA
ncbi:DNA-processing protein DprA [Parasphaerochaeta coccoides]|nr:DNA-processing protein DprA [Parasphaerochaeta coccoides]